MKRLVRLLVFVGVVAFVLRRFGLSISFGSVVLDDAELAILAGRPLDLTVFGMVSFPSGTSPQLAASAVKRLRVLGLLQADRPVLEALSGRIMSAGAIHSVD